MQQLLPTLTSIADVAFRLRVDNPYTGEAVCEVAYDSKAEAHAKLDAAVKAQLDWKNVPLNERQRLCTNWIHALASNAADIADDISGMMGKPVQQARNEINGTIDRAKYSNEFIIECDYSR